MSVRSRGRPPTFDLVARQYFAELLRVHGARRAREMSEIPISVQTLLKIAREFGIPLKKGRRLHLEPVGTQNHTLRNA